MFPALGHFVKPVETAPLWRSGSLWSEVRWEPCPALRCRRRMGRSRFRSPLSVGSAAVLVGAVVVAAMAGASRARSSVATSSPSTGCKATVIVGVLPVWARGGFSDPRPRMPYVLGRAGKIAAILWADPLQSPAPKITTTRSCGSLVHPLFRDLICGSARSGWRVPRRSERPSSAK
jgi:hypothetical protein